MLGSRKKQRDSRDFHRLRLDAKLQEIRCMSATTFTSTEEMAVADTVSTGTGDEGRRSPVKDPTGLLRVTINDHDVHELMSENA